MARIAFVKVFTGLQMGIAQLSGELQRAGHQSLIVYFKDYVFAPESEGDKYCRSELGGAYVAAKGKLVNGNLYKPFSDQEYELLFDTLRRFGPDMIGFSLCSVAVAEVAQVTERVRLAFPGVPLIWGGVGPTLEPERCLQWADMVCVGEADQSIVEIAERLDAGEPLTHIPNIWTKLPNGEVAKGPGRPLIEIDQTALPDYEASRSVWINDDKRQWNIYPHSMGRQYHMMTQRGCPYSCSFCVESWYQDQHGKSASLRRMSVDRALEELRYAKERYRPLGVMFYDDVFTVNPRWLREFAPRYKREIGLPFWCYTYPRSTRKDDIELLRDAGCVSMTMGVQSGSQTVLREYNRPVDDDISVRAAQIIVDAGIQGLFDLMTMSEYETEETCRETFEFLLRFPTGMKSVGFYPMNLFPNYGYTLKVEQNKLKPKLTPGEYEYWHKLYLLTRTEVPRSIVRALGRSRIVRRFPRLLDPMLPDKLPFFWLDNGALDLETGTLKLTDATGSIAGEEDLHVPAWLRPSSGEAYSELESAAGIAGTQRAPR
jgi:anaerobic magnesium-protoporphyrin IX monomethyl ester cyclase